MTQPATGDLWPNAYGFDTGSARKALYGSVLLRDGDGVHTALDFVEINGIWQSGFNPFAADGQFRTDLKVEQGGTFYDCGAGSTDGPRFANKFDVKKEHIWQTRQVIRTDITSEEGTVRFGMAEYSSLSDTLEMDLPLVSTPAKGSANYARKRPKELEGRIRQAIVYTVDKGGFYTADVFPSLSIEGLEDRDLSPEELIKSIFTWGVSIDPHSGYSHARFRTGPGWESNPGPPVFPGAAPVATAGASGAVALVFPTPVGPASPFEYSVKKTQVDTGVITDLTLSGSPAVSGGNVTLNGTGLTATKEFTFQVYAENAVGGLSISKRSNKVTGTA